MNGSRDEEGTAMVAGKGAAGRVEGLVSEATWDS